MSESVSVHARACERACLSACVWVRERERLVSVHGGGGRGRGGGGVEWGGDGCHPCAAAPDAASAAGGPVLRQE